MTTHRTEPTNNGSGTPIASLVGPPSGPGLVTILRQRRDASLASLDRYASRFATHDDLDLASQTELEQRLDDFAHYDRLLDTVGRSAANAQALTEVYRAGGPFSFFADLVHRGLHRDPAATARLNAHVEEVRRSGAAAAEISRDIGTAASGALVAPAYLTELTAPVARATGLLAAVPFRYLPPEGMTVKVPRVTAGPEVAPQSAENDGAQETNVATSDLTLSVSTVTGKVDASRQSFDRASWMIDGFLYPDLIDSYRSGLGSLMINGTGTSGQPYGILNTSGITSVTWTDPSPTAAEFLAKVTSAAKQASANRKLPMTAVVMHSRRWYWLCSLLDTAGTLAVPVSTVPPGLASPYVGTIAGMGVIVDDNIPTTASTDQDRVIVCRPSDFALAADPEPGFTVAEAAAIETVPIIARGYAVFTAARYASGIAVISGTGLADPGSW